MNKYLGYVFLSVFFFSCENREIKSKVHHKEGNLEIVEYYGENNILDSTIVFSKKNKRLKKTIYKNGKKLSELKFHDDNKASVINFYPNREIESSGNVMHNRKIGWWSTFTEVGELKNRYEFITVNGKEYLNQYYTYNKDGKIINNKSNYLKYEIPDTLPLGKTKIKCSYYPKFTKGNEVFICLGYDVNDDFSNINDVRIDTFYFKGSDPHKWLGLRFKASGKKIVRGFIYERLLETKHNIDEKKNSSLSILETKVYFEKKIFVNN